MNNDDRIKILKQEVDKLTDEIIKHTNESNRLDIIRDVLQKEIEFYQPKKEDNELPF